MHAPSPSHIPCDNGLAQRIHATCPLSVLFVTPSAPVLKRTPPSGPEWLDEVKHDGWRAQLHHHDGGATILSKRGKDISGRFAAVRSALRSLPPCVIDAEIVGCDAHGVPDFRSLMAATPTASAHGASICCR
jgi:bifunctional non-homologous end joining protein LigD